MFLSDARQPEVICGRSGTICPKTKPMLKNAKSPFPVDVRRWKTCLFNLSNLSPIFVWSGAAEFAVNSVKFPDKGLTVGQ